MRAPWNTRPPAAADFSTFTLHIQATVGEPGSCRRGAEPQCVWRKAKESAWLFYGRGLTAVSRHGVNEEQHSQSLSSGQTFTWQPLRSPARSNQVRRRVLTRNVEFWLNLWSCRFIAWSRFYFLHFCTVWRTQVQHRRRYRPRLISQAFREAPTHICRRSRERRDRPTGAAAILGCVPSLRNKMVDKGTGWQVSGPQAG